MGYQFNSETTLKNTFILGALVITSFLLNACSSGGAPDKIEGVVSSSNDGNQTMSQYNINSFPINKLVCDPFDPTPTPSPKHGIKGQLWYRGAGQPRYYKVMDYIEKTTKSDQALFLSSINVPTRLFSSGFPIATGDFVKDDSGNKLIEYFAMKYESQIVLADDEAEGLYEFALLSDDGSILKIKEPDANNILPASWESHINNDGDTPTRMKCSSRFVDMKKGKKIAMELYYYQGPRNHIANMLIWRKAAPGAVAGGDAYCNQSGNSFYFDPDNNSNPLKWNDLVARNWKVLSSNNFLLPETPVDPNVPASSENLAQGEVNYNACYQGELAKITNFKLVENLGSQIAFSWDTDIDATAQLLVINLDTGEQVVTLTDNVLRTNHSVIVTGLSSGANYRFQAVAISATLGKTISAGIDIQTY